MVLFSAAFLSAQDSSSVVGVVTDATGAVIPSTTVTLSNSSTGVSFTQVADNTGTYRFLNVPANVGYKMTFAHEGFATSEVSDITLNVGSTRTQNARLKVGGEAQTVQVSGGNEAVTLDTTDATIGNNIDVEQLNGLPIYDRTAGIQTLFYQQPGVDSNQGAVTGARIDQTEITVDGLDVNDIATGQFGAIVGQAPVDSVDQFTGSVAGLGSGSGTGSGGQFDMVTKGGTNKFHGNVNEYHRDTSTVANTWFNNLDGVRRTPLIQNQFGGDLGGPALKNKLFFFFDLADSRIVRSASAERTIPLPAFRAGTLNYINDGAGCGDSSRLNTQPSCISTLSASQVAALDPNGIGFDQAELTYINSRYPATINDPAGGDGVNTGGYRFTAPDNDNRTTYVTRVDYNLTQTQKVFGRFTIDRRNAVESLPEFPTDPLTHPFMDDSYAYVISHTWNIGKNKVNQVYYGDTISKFNFPDLFNPTGANQYTFSGLDGPYTNFDGQKRRIPIPVVRDDFSWQHHAHSFTMGGTFKFIKTNSNLTANFNFPEIGEYGALGPGLDATLRPPHIANSQVADNDWDALFSSALGVVGSISTNYNYNNAGVAQAAGSGGPRAYRYFQTEAYFGDSWKIARKLTLDYGLRYQYYSVPYEAHGEESVSSAIDLTTYINDRLTQSKAGDTSNTGLPIYSYVLGGKANNGPDFYKPDWKDFAPRVGFAWTPYDSQKTVVTGSIGILYDRTVIEAINFLQDQISYLFSNQQIANFGSSNVAATLATDTRVGSGLSYPATLNPAPSPISSPLVPYVDGTGTPYGLAGGATSFVISPTLRDPYSIAMNIGIQQEFPGHTILKLNYVGRLGRRLIADADASQVIDVPDYTGLSNQTMAQAFAGLTRQERSGAAITPEPWFENVLGTGYQGILGNNTNLVAAMAGQLPKRGDMSDSLQALAQYSYYYGFTGFLPTNIGIPSQFGTNAYLTNMGNSNYHGMLLTVDKNLSQGLRAEFNYSWSHSIDNTSVSANANPLFTYSNFICDILHPRACRGSSDFDVRQEIASNFEYHLPFGRGQQWGANSPRWLDEAVGNWSFSGLPYYRTGLAISALSDAYMASFDNADPAIYIGTSKADLKAKVNVDHSSNIVYSFANGADGAAKAFADFRGPIGIEYGSRNVIRGPGAFFFDAGLGKKFPILESGLNLQFRADAYNLLNHPAFGTGNLNIVTNASEFGQITGTDTGPGGEGSRVAQFSLRLEF